MTYITRFLELIHQSEIRRNSERGFSMWEMLGVLALVVLVGKGTATWLADYRETAAINEAAEHMEKVSSAAAQYVADNFGTLTAALPLNGAAESIPLSTLKQAGYLSANVADVNSYGQSYSVRVRYVTQGSGSNARNVLEPLVVTEGGRAIPDRHLLRIAGKIRTGGAIRSSDPDTAIGNAGGWQVAMSSFGGSPGAGHITAGLFYSDAGMLEDYLYRHQVPGRPELNQMATDLHMADNAIHFTAANGRSIRMENDSGRMRWVDQNTHVEVASLDGATGRFSAAGRLIGGEHLQLLGVAVEGEACDAEGLIGRDANGLILSCQSSVWRKQDFCTPFSGNLNDLHTSGCYNGNMLGNAPSGDWFFIEVMRHYSTGNYYTVQRATGMTGGVAGKVWVRSQQSASSGVGWGPWSSLSEQSLTISGQYNVYQSSAPELGWHKMCFVTGASGYPQGGVARIWPIAGPDANGRYYWVGSSQIWNGTANVDFWITCLS